MSNIKFPLGLYPGVNKERRQGDTAAATINRASELLREEKYAEALELLNTVKDDHRSLNARGVALYMTGSHEEGIAAIRRAAALGNEQAKNNLKQLTE